MKIFIPVVGDQLRLTHDITTSVRFAGQNKRFARKLADSKQLKEGDDIEITLRKNTQLKVERVYVRQGPGAEFDSVTFRIGKENASGLPDGRFFLPIDVINTLDVELVQNDVQEKPESFRVLVERLYREASIEERINDTYLDTAFSEFDSLPSVLAGNITVDIKQECLRVRKAVNAMLKDNGIDSVETLLMEAKKHINADKFAQFESRLDAANMSMQRIQEHAATTQYPLYRFELKFRNGEPLIALSSYERGFLEDINNYVLVAHTLINTLTEKYVHPVKTILNLLCYTGDRDSYGRYSNKHNYSPKMVIKRKDREGAVLPRDAFTDNVLTRTKSDDHGYVFHYELNDRTLTVSEMRKEINSLQKELAQ
ncbi:MAG: hypothetical protein CL840_01355 [Crocinitomicaceae bacterium]|nr:hypothetical protein [Crocinitomicaceae bacterium]